ncbi:YEATS domain-containing protein 2 [Cricetulus griseus]|uniref:YEATS domain-containing protein 2 n=1 Tax=Cricetulus griseus TaxID=10029 RepID=A0A061I7R1_CRIGR|nr:YEATS domain-containing protein 2 [Cricetulus griseus]
MCHHTWLIFAFSGKRCKGFGSEELNLDMSGIKRTIKETDPDYEDVSVALPNKRHKAIESSARDAAVQKIETIIKEQFALEMKNKEHEIDVIDQRLIEARRMMDKLRACIVANYYASAGLLKVSEGLKTFDTMAFNHPAIKKFLESPSRSSSPTNQRSETPSANHSESDSLSQHNDFLSDKDNNSNMDVEERLSTTMEQRSSRNPGRVLGLQACAPYLVTMVLETEPKAWYKLEKHSIN